MVNPSRRPPGQAGGVTTTTKSLLTWTLLLLSAAAGQAKIDHHVSVHKIHNSATAEVASPVPRRPEAGRSPAEIPLLNNDLHTAKFRSTNAEYTNLDNRYQDGPAPAQDSAVRAPLGQSVESYGPTAIPGARLLRDWEADDIVLLSTIDGSLHARDRRTGSHRWTLDMPEDPMIKTVHYPQNRSSLDDATPDHEYMFIVEPSKDGQLYAQFTNPATGLVKLPATVKKMVTEAPFTMHVNDQYLATSSEYKSKAYTIDAYTGEILYEFPKHRSSGQFDPQPRCRRRNDLEFEDPACQPGRTLRLGRNVYTFTISDEQSGQDLCTITFSEWVTNKGDDDLQQQHVRSLDDYNDQIYANGAISIINAPADAEPSRGKSHRLNSPVARVFDVIRARDDQDGSTDLVLLSKPIDLPLPGTLRYEMKYSQLVFVNKTEAGQWFAMSEYSYPGCSLGAPAASLQRNHDGSLLDLNGDLDEIVGVHVLSTEHMATEHRVTEHIAPALDRLTISSAPENDNSNMIEDPIKEIASQEPAQAPALMSGSSVDAKSWSSGFFGVILGGIIVLLLNSKWNFSNNRALQNTSAPLGTNIVSSKADAPSAVLIETPDSTGLVQQAEQPEIHHQILAYDVKADEIIASGHSRVQSASSTDSSPKKKSVKIGDVDDNNSTDVDSDDEDNVIEGRAKDNDDQVPAESITGTQPKKFKTKRGKRGGRKNKKKVSVDPAAFDEKPTISVEQHLDNGMVQIGRLKVDISEEKCLGRGSNGTAVYPGILDSREVAVKRLIKSANNLAEKEIKHLVSSDENAHVIRYFGKEESRDFFYIALDQFTTSLDQFIEHPERFPTLVDPTNGFDVKDCLRQITDGVQHLHSLKLVHRDIKPQNVLVRAVKSNRPVIGMPKLQFVISDFGLCKPLEDGAMSTFAPTANHTAAGTTGWRAPELLVSPRDAIAAPNAESTSSKTASTTHSLDGTAIDLPTGRRATKAIDIFSLGCVYYYVMTRGGHPFDVGGSSLGRDLNIKENNFTTELMRFHKYEYDAEDLVMQMVNHEPKSRPDTAGVLKHPYFWTPEQKLEFVCLVSDCYEREKNSILDLHAKGPVTRTSAEEESLVELAELEALAPNVIGINSKREIRDFLQALPRTFLNGMGKQRSYSGTKMIDLLRLIRNKKNHFRDLPEEVQSLILARGPSLEEGYYGFWADRFPSLLINCHTNIVERHLIERFRLERWYE